MTEVEVKILEIDIPAVEEKLVSLGAKKVFEGDLQASLFDFSDGHLDKDHSFVRLRTKGEKVELAFKKRISKEVAKSYEELEVEVNDAIVAKKILEALGLVEKVHGRTKHRISYALENVHFELDEFEGMPPFLEIEVNSSNELSKWVEALGYSMADTKAWGGREVYEHYGIEYPRV